MKKAHVRTRLVTTALLNQHHESSDLVRVRESKTLLTRGVPITFSHRAFTGSVTKQRRVVFDPYPMARHGVALDLFSVDVDE